MLTFLSKGTIMLHMNKTLPQTLSQPAAYNAPGICSWFGRSDEAIGVLMR